MRQASRENPVINSPFSEPERHFKFDNQRITEEIVQTRRQSEYFIPIPKPRSWQNDQMLIEDLTDDTLHENKYITEALRQIDHLNGANEYRPHDGR